MISASRNRSQKAVVNALSQAVGVNGVAEVQVGVAILVAQRRGGHADLVGGGEVFEDLAPVASLPWRCRGGTRRR